MVVPMNARRRHHPRPSPGFWCRGWLAASLLLAGQVIRAEDDIAVDDIDPVTLQRQQQQQASRHDLGANFENNIFEQTNNFSPAGRRRRIELGVVSDQAPKSTTLAFVRRLGEDRLARIDAICGLTDAQRRKLRLAMESDVRRLAEEIEPVRTKYAGVVVNLSDQEGQRKWQELQQDVQRCRQLFQGLFDEESLFVKVLPTTLDAEQQARLTAEIAARRSYRWRAIVAGAIRKYDDTLGLDQGQYDEIEKLLLEREPPLRVEGPVNRNAMQAQQMLVFMVLSEVEAKRLQSVVSDRQWQVLAQLANQGKAMRSHIEAQGLLEKGAK
jgi:hypothetical protein